MTKDEALKLALEALEEAWYHVGTFQPTEKAIDLYEEARAAIKEALAQPKQDWSMLEAMQGSLREHMARIKELEAQLAQPEQKPMHPQLKAMLEDYFDKCFAESKPKCNTHPKAPHGFNRNASHSADRYVCECEAWDPYEAGRQDGIEAMLKYDNPAPYVFLTATEIVDCATATYQCDPNDVTENDIKFARHIERLTLER